MLLVLLGILVCAAVVGSIRTPRANEHRDRYWASNTEEWVSSEVSEASAAHRYKINAALTEIRAEGRRSPSTNPLGPQAIQFTADSTPIIVRALYYSI